MMPSFTFTDPEGQIWASKYEYQVFRALLSVGAPVRRSVSGSSDTFSYNERKLGVKCLECGSTSCVQARTYTSDMFIPAPAGGEVLGPGTLAPGYWVEAKGYFRPDKRRLFRAFRKSRPDVNLRLVVQSNLKVGKGTIISWARSLAKVEAHVWNPNRDDVTDVVPKSWRIWEDE